MQDNTEKKAEIKKIVDTEEPVVEKEVEKEVITDLSFSTRKNFRIDGDNKRVLSLDVSDMNVITRLNEVYPKMEKLATEAIDTLAKQSDTDDDVEDLKNLATVLADIDKKMREQIDYIFDADVSAKCVPAGNMYDPVGGEFRFEHVIDVISQLYATNLSKEFKTMQDKVKKHTDKYTSKSTSKRKK